ncbi:helix-turn-helix domain-containing protein [Croceibacterium aestuarii]|uniref:helix-turn-helix domain-containing protein n=1 Tax=Croceibacterium aestuarii TaxID=3064139 RepID=UPI00272EA3AC|nr:helix-turn-helix transcriptional regulator [Croceibacterium sp. D39]
MAGKALYIGPRLKRVRRDLRLTQADMAVDLGISPSYVALMERNQRPVTADMLVKLAAAYRIDIADLAAGEVEETAARMQAILRAPLYAGIDLPKIDIEDVAASYPGFAEALMRLHAAHEQLWLTLAEQREKGVEDVLDPVEETRHFLAQRRNYFPSLDDSASALAARLKSWADMAAHIEHVHELEVRFVPPAEMRHALRFHDFHRRRVLINARLTEDGRRFQLALQIAALEQSEAIAELVRDPGIVSDNGRTLAAQALRGYWAAALVMPYDAFLTAARRQRFDIEGLAAEFAVSFEQAAHRLTTLQKPGAAGVPFFFLRLDSGGNVSKRLDASGFPFARFGGACPLWNVHDCFARRGELLLQRIELPEGGNFVSIARSVEVRGWQHGHPRLVRAVALVCPEDYLDELAYADDLRKHERTPVGTTCRLCHRPDCAGRSAPPIGREILSDTYLRASEPFALSGE